MTPENVPMSDDAASQLDKQLPKPAGYMLLIALPKVEKTFASGLAKADSTVQRETITTMHGTVFDMGPDAYKDTAKFPTGPYCKEGDHVLFKAYSGLRFKVGDMEWRMIADDMVQGVVEDPSGISHV